MRPVLLLLLVFILLSSPIYAQKGLKFTHISANKGLSQSVIQCILKDKKGFMWFGTSDGLNKYDGVRMETYSHDKEKKGSISSNNINDLFEDNHGNLWIATQNGLNKFDKKKKVFFHYRLNEVSGVFVNKIFQDGKGNVWLGTQKGLFIFDIVIGAFKVYKHGKESNSISNDHITEIAEDVTGELWIGTANGLNRFNPVKNTFIRYMYNPLDVQVINDDHIAALSRNSKNDILVGTKGGGLSQYNRDNDSFISLKASAGPCDLTTRQHILCFEEGPDNQLWIGTENDGLFIYNYANKSLKCYKNDPEDASSLASNSIQSMYKDNIGNMWIGTYEAGVELLPEVPDKFIHYTSSNGLNNKVVKAILQEEDGNLWISTDGGGINFFDKKNNKFSYLINDSENINTINSNTSHCLLALNEDTLVFGHHRGGLDLYSKKKGKFFHYLPDPNDSNSVSDVTISSLYKDKEGNLWVGTWMGGLNFFNIKTGQFKSYKNNPLDDNSISSNLVYSIKEDKEGNLWLGTNKGVEMFSVKKKIFIHYLCDTTRDERISSNLVNCVHIDQKNNIWAGTLGGGLNLLDRKTKSFTTFKEKDGLSNNSVEGILEDSKGNLWLSTNNGICKFNPETRSFRSYGVADGVQSNEFKRNSCFTNKQGEMFFGGINGFNEFHPDSIKDNPFIPEVVFTHFQIFNQPVNAGDKDLILSEDISVVKQITLEYYHSVFSLKFAALNYINPEKNQYAYKLEGFDKNWNYVSTEKKATYTNLDPGKYIFKVKASNNDGIWNERGASIIIIIRPPFWKTWWFKMLIVSTIMGSAYAFYLVKISSVERQKKILERQVEQRTEELLIANNELYGQKEELQTLTENLASQATILQHANGEIQSLYSEIKDSIRAALVIQNVILPSREAMKKYLPQSFILYKPKDVVSGDFYWFNVKDDRIVIAAVDCTGHGVSGAFMSINGYHLLNQVTDTETELEANEILNRLNEEVANAFEQQGDAAEVYDGMDIALCIIEKDKRRIQYAGANNPLYIYRNNDIVRVKADKFAIGRSVKGKINKFKNNNIDLQEGDTLYIFSDGYADQLGGPDGEEKFLYPRFRDLLMNIGEQNMEDQQSILDKSLTDWRGKHEQIDDVLVIGFKV